jgi:hypothetical protein
VGAQDGGAGGGAARLAGEDVELRNSACSCALKRHLALCWHSACVLLLLLWHVLVS